MTKNNQFEMTDILTLECDEEATHADCAKSLQRAINSGMWSLQGSYGRSMMAAIEAGDCMLDEDDCRDAYGSHVPSRSQVKEGTKGSRAFVVARHGEKWANMLEAI